MPIDRRFLERVQSLNSPGMGTESAAFLLYSLVRMARPRSVMEVGLGYTTPFIALALADAREEFEYDRRVIEEDIEAPARRGLLAPEYHRHDYTPRLHAIDDFSLESSTAPKVLGVLKDLGLERFVRVHEGDFRGYSRNLSKIDLPLDFVWFDCGGPQDYIDFIREYWSLINPDHGVLALHFTYWSVSVQRDGGKVREVIPSPIANEIKRQQFATGISARFEAMSLLEPHKNRQGSVTLVRKLPPRSVTRARRFASEMQMMTSREWKDFPQIS